VIALMQILILCRLTGFEIENNLGFCDASNFLCHFFLQDGKQNHVSFPGITQNGSAKQFSHGKYQTLCCN
jgi:hypothetical protein